MSSVPRVAPDAASPLARAALEYAERGWAVFPLSPRSKIPFKGSHGFEDATTDTDQIRQWWTTHPDANIGVATGARSGIVVVDVDLHKDGVADALERLEAEHGKLPPTLTSLTGGGGIQFFFACNGHDIGSKNDALAPGIDVKGDGGYVVVPRSIHPNGTAYKWNPHAPTASSPAPDWIATTVSAESPGCIEVDHGVSRHEIVLRMSAQLAKGGMTQEQTETICQQVMAKMDPTKDRTAEVRRLVVGAYPDHGLLQVEAINLSQLDPDPPAWSVDAFIEHGKLHMWWAAPGVGKSYLMLTLIAHLMAGPGGKLWGNDALNIRRRYQRVLWVSGEESAGRVAWRWQRVRRGAGDPTGELLHIWAPGPPRIGLQHLPQLMAEYEPDALVVDPLRVLLPPTWDGKPVNWDADTAAAHSAAATIRGAAADRGADLFTLHHPRKAGDTYGGPVAWEAAMDVMVGLRRKGEVIAATTEKLREGRRPEQFHLVLQHTDRDVRALLSTDPSVRLSDRARRAVAFVTDAGGGLVQAELLRQLGAEYGIERPTAYNYVSEALAAGQLRHTDRKIGNSPVLEVADSALTVEEEDSP